MFYLKMHQNVFGGLAPMVSVFVPQTMMESFKEIEWKLQLETTTDKQTLVML